MYGKPKPRSGSNPSQTVSVDTASPKTLILMLFDGAIRFGHRAIHCMEKGDQAGKGKYIGKSQAIVQELQNVLDVDAAPEVGSTLFSLYGYIVDLLTTANLNSDSNPVLESIELLKTIRSGFAEVADDDSTSAMAAGVG